MLSPVTESPPLLWTHRFPRCVAVLPGILNGRAGGAVRSASLHASMLASRGIKVEVLALDAPGLPAERHEFALDGCRVTCHAAQTGAGGPWSPGLLRRLAELAPWLDLVHLNGHWLTLNHAAAALCRSRGIPYIISSRAGLSATGRGTLPPDDLRRLIPAEDEMVAGASALHMTTTYEVRSALLPARRPPVLNIPNQVALDHVAPGAGRGEARAALGITPGEVALVFLGRVVPEKTPGLLIEALARSAGTAHFRLHLVGPVDNAYRQALEGVARAAGVAERVCFQGYAAGAERGVWLRAADLFLLPSVGENFCLALVEAAACGAFCVTSPFVGALEFLSPLQYSVAPLVAEAWAVALEAYAREPRVPPAGAWEELSRRFSADAVAPAWMQAYRRVGCVRVPMPAIFG